MLFGLLSLTWYDVIPVILSIISVVLVQLINTTAQLLQTDEKTSIISNSTTNGNSIPKAEGTNGTTTTTTPSTSPIASPTSHKKLEKQLSDFVLEEKNHTQAARSQTLPPTPPTPNSLQSFNSFDANDEYNEDEDTLSLDNLFPCDQTEIYASKEISYIIDELIQTEMNYVNNLRKGLQNYGEIYLREDAPEALKSMEKQQQILNNTADILELHEKHILPMMIKNQYDLKQMFDEFGQFIEKNHFYCYVIFTMNKKASMQLRQEHREWFLNYQSEIKDKLGIDSFLVQPIQRLTRYPLLLQQFISKFYKSHINCKPVLVSLCKLETRMRRLLQVVNQAEELPSIEELQEIELSQLGNFRKATEFDAYHFRSRKKYRAKVFLFDRCLLCAELRKKRLSYRQHYLWDSIEMQLNNAKNVKILVKAAAVSNGSAGVSNGSSKSAKEELELSTIEGVSIKQWLLFVQKVVEDARRDAKESTAFTLPTEIVLCIVFVLWALWHIL